MSEETRRRIAGKFSGCILAKREKVDQEPRGRRWHQWHLMVPKRLVAVHVAKQIDNLSSAEPVAAARLGYTVLSQPVLAGVREGQHREIGGDIAVDRADVHYWK